MGFSVGLVGFSAFETLSYMEAPVILDAQFSFTILSGSMDCFILGIVHGMMG